MDELVVQIPFRKTLTPREAQHYKGMSEGAKEAYRRRLCQEALELLKPIRRVEGATGWTVESDFAKTFVILDGTREEPNRNDSLR